MRVANIVLGVRMSSSLKSSLNAWHLWGLAVGLVISGEYFGWSYGWDKAGTLGFLVTTILIALMYTTFIFSFTELTTAIPHAGGPFAYARRAFGPKMAFVAGFATLVEFVFAPPAIAMAIGAYLNVQFPELNPKVFAIGAYLIFVALNIIGVRIAATFELVVTVLAIVELLVFMGVVSPGFSFSNFVLNVLAGSVAMAAEEAKEPAKTIPRAYIAGILTLVFLALGVMIFAGGVGDWKALSNINDPLPQAMKTVVGENSGWLHMLVWIGLFGLVASFHGIILGYSRQIFALSRAGFMPAYLGAVNSRFQTPHRAIIAGALVGIAAILVDDMQFNGMTLTANLITMAVFGAIVMYIVSMLSLFALRKKEPFLTRPFAAIAYPYFPAVALVLACFSLLTMIYYNLSLALFFFGLMAVAYVYFSLTQNLRDKSVDSLVHSAT